MNGLIFLPWAVKPMIGFMSDLVPIFGFRKAPVLDVDLQNPWKKKVKAMKSTRNRGFEAFPGALYARLHLRLHLGL